MTTHNAPSGNERAPTYSLVALSLLADPVSTLLGLGRLIRVAAVELRQDQTTTRDELVLLHECACAIARLAQNLKETITAAFGAGDIDAATAQCLIDHYELWGD
jgi:hypothetical protein